MSAESDYIRAERDNILRTMDMIEDLTAKEEFSTYETIALVKTRVKTRDSHRLRKNLGSHLKY